MLQFSWPFLPRTIFFKPIEGLRFLFLRSSRLSRQEKEQPNPNVDAQLGSIDRVRPGQTEPQEKSCQFIYIFWGFRVFVSQTSIPQENIPAEDEDR